MIDEGGVLRSAMGGIQSLVAREAGYSVAAECLRVQAEAEGLDPSLRSPDSIRLHPDAWPWYQGAVGEIHVGQLLASLGPTWKVLHSVPIGREDSDVDHILVGPNGVFVLNTKHHVGASIWVGDFRLMINRTKTDNLRNAASENRKVAQRLTSKVDFPVTVRSAIVVVGERSIKDIRHSDARPVAVLSSLDVARWLTSQPATASATQLDLIRLAAEEPDTWHIDPHRADNLRVMHRFARLQDAVGSTPPRPIEPAPADHLPPAGTTVPSRARSPRISAPQARTTKRRSSAQSRRSERQSKRLAEGIVAVGFLVVMVTMINNGTWMPFVMGIFSALSPSP